MKLANPWESFRKQLSLTPWSKFLLEKLIITHLVEKVPGFYETQNVQYVVHNSPSLVPILSQMSPVHIITPWRVLSSITQRRVVRWKSTDVSEEHVASVLIVEEHAYQKTRRYKAASLRYVPPKLRLTFNGLHGVISQMIWLFVTTAVRTSNPTSSHPAFKIKLNIVSRIVWRLI
jgi:hypothetical protein